MTQNLCGIFPPIATPFNSDGELMIDWFNENIERLSKTGLAGILVAGSNGESPFLSDDEILRMLRGARARMRPDMTLIAGAGKESTRLSSEFIRKAADAGADLALVGTPCYFKPYMNDDALFAHFWSIADDSPIPVLIYNVPQFTGVSTSTKLVEKLSAHENIAGMKDSSANIAFQADVRHRTPERFRIVVGSAPTMLASFIVGACGGVTAIAGVLPDATVEVHQTFFAGDWKKAAALLERLSPPAAAVTTGFGMPGLKAAMTLMGLHGGEPRLPLLPLNDTQRAALVAIFQKAGYLAARTA